LSKPQQTNKGKMLNIFVVYVENKPGVLTRVASLFRRRAFNIDSLTVGRTEKPEVSRMTITVDTNPDQAKRIEANLYNLVNVLLVENITHEPAIARDLAMIKVAATHEARSHVLELASVFRARVVDVDELSIVIEVTDTAIVRHKRSWFRSDVFRRRTNQPIVRALLIAGLMVGLNSGALAQDYPIRQVKIIIAFSPCSIAPGRRRSRQSTWIDRKMIASPPM
jgi:acetolactate synthase small subunit